LSIFNLGSTATNAGEITLIAENDIAQLLKYDEAAYKDLINGIIFR
jgi:hypothetical protein